MTITTESKEWKFYIHTASFCKLFEFERDISKSHFIGHLITCTNEHMKMITTGTEKGYCVCMEIKHEISKSEIDAVLNEIDRGYFESLNLSLRY